MLLNIDNMLNIGIRLLLKYYLYSICFSSLAVLNNEIYVLDMQAVIEIITERDIRSFVDGDLDLDTAESVQQAVLADRKALNILLNVLKRRCEGTIVETTEEKNHVET